MESNELIILAKSLKNICDGVHFSKVGDLEPAVLLKIDFLHRYFARILLTFKEKAILKNSTYWLFVNLSGRKESMIFWLQRMNKIFKCLNSLLIALHSFHPWCIFWGKFTKSRIVIFFKKKKMNLLRKVNMFSLVSFIVKCHAFQANTVNELQYTVYSKRVITVYSIQWTNHSILYIQISNNNFCNFAIPFDPPLLWTALHKKWSFPLRIPLVNVTKSIMENFNFCAIL